MPPPPLDAQVTERTTCRVCRSSALVPVMDLGRQCIAGAFPERASSHPAPERYPLELVRCDRESRADACGLIQLRHTIRGDLLYDSYWYRSGINRTMTRNLHEIATQASALVDGLQPADLVVDIGCNDGTLLDGYQAIAPSGVDYLGIDPSDVTRYAIDKGYDVVQDFFSSETFRQRHPDRQAKIVTSIAMFYDLEDPSAFVTHIAASLADNGVWVSEFSYMPTMLKMNSFDTICHEHLEYYSLAVIERLFQSAGLQVLNAELNDVNGGSIRLFAGKAGNNKLLPEHDRGLETMRAAELDVGLDTAQPYVDFVRRSEHVRRDLLELLRSLKNDGRRVHIYGASTKGNTLLQYCGIDNSLVECAADRNPDKWKSETIGTHIPIISEEESRGLLPDYYLVLPWHFLDEMIDREREFFERGGKFIVPLPDVRIVEGVPRGR